MTHAPSTTRADPFAPSDLVRCGLAVLGVLFFATGLDLYGYQQLGTPNPTFVMLGMAAVLGALTIANPRRPPPFGPAPLALWIAGWAAITAIWALLVGSVPGRIELMERAKAIFLLATLVATFADDRARRAGGRALAVAVIVMAVCNVADLAGLLHLGKEQVEDSARQLVSGRASGLIYNANEAGRSITFATAVAFWWVPRGYRIPLLLVGALGLLVTFSRGSMLAFLVLIAWALWRRQLSGWFSLLALGLAAVAAAVGGTEGQTQSVLSSVGAWNDDVALRVHFSEWASDDSGRGELLVRAWTEFQRSPLLGHPYGQADLLAPHNMYVALAVDHGVTGLLILPALALAIVFSNRRMAPFALIVLLAGLFSHVLLMEHGLLVALALATSGSPVPEPTSDARAGAPPTLAREAT